MTPQAYLRIRLAQERWQAAARAYEELLLSHGLDPSITWRFDDQALTIKEVVLDGDLHRER